MRAFAGGDEKFEINGFDEVFIGLHIWRVRTLASIAVTKKQADNLESANMLRALLKKLGFFKPSAPALALYDACVTEARRETYYTRLAVQDTVDGRFDLITLMVSLVLHRIGRIKDGGHDATRLGQDLFEVMFADMDANLRAMGVSDEGIKYRIREMSSAFMGRMRAYTGVLDRREGKDGDGWPQTLARNVYRSDNPDVAGAAELAARVDGLNKALKGLPDDRVSHGDIAFPGFSAPKGHSDQTHQPEQPRP